MFITITIFLDSANSKFCFAAVSSTSGQFVSLYGQTVKNLSILY